VYEIDHFAEASAHFVATFYGLEVGSQLPFVDAGDAAARVDAAFGDGQSLPANVGGQNLDVPGI